MFCQILRNSALKTRWEQTIIFQGTALGVVRRQGLVQLVTYLGGHCLCFLLCGWGRFINYNFFIYCHTYNRFLFWQSFFQSLCSWNFRRASFKSGGNCTSNVKLLCNSWLFCCVSVDNIFKFKSNSFSILIITLWLLCHLKCLTATVLQPEANPWLKSSCEDKCRQECQK